MSAKKRKGREKIPAHLAEQLSELESQAAHRGLTVHYDLMEAAGLKLSGGLCRVQGHYHLFIDRRSTTAERIEAIRNCLRQPLEARIHEGQEEISERSGNDREMPET